MLNLPKSVIQGLQVYKYCFRDLAALRAPALPTLSRAARPCDKPTAGILLPNVQSSVLFSVNNLV